MLLIERKKRAAIRREEAMLIDRLIHTQVDDASSYRGVTRDASD